jgi:hypothetical protein
MLRKLGETLAAQGIKNVLVFVNHYMTSIGAIDNIDAYNSFPEYTQAFRDAGVHCVPQHLEDVGKNILLATNVYLEFREDICWLDERLQQKIKSGEFKNPSVGTEQMKQIIDTRKFPPDLTQRRLECSLVADIGALAKIADDSECVSLVFER